MSRRNFLLSYLANSGKFYPYSYEYLFHDLIPTTISGKQVKNKARIDKIYANGVIENQLAPVLYDYTHSGGIVFTTSNNGRKATLSGTSSTYWTYNLIFDKEIPVGSKVLVSVKLTNPNSLMFGYRLRNESELDYSGNSQLQIYTTTKKIDRIQFYGDPNHDYTGCEIEDVQVVYLNQYNPFDTPTTLTDKRIVNILNRGYIPYNKGEYKGTTITEFSTTKADTTSLDTLPFKYQGNGVGTAHDTLEKTDTEWVFTKNIISYTFNGTETFVDWVGSGKSLTIVLNNMKGASSNADKGNIMWSLGETCPSGIINNDMKEYSIGDNTSGRLYIATTKTSADLASALAGKTIYFETTTPQVISIPRKHLAVVDLGALSWNNSESLASGLYSAVVSGMNTDTEATTRNKGIFSSKYPCSTTLALNNSMDDKSMLKYAGNIYIRDSAFVGKTTAEVKALLSGVYLFYETQDEVADIETKIDIEPNGTITTDSDILPNVDFGIKCK